jgi:hypothetical protein
MYSNNSSTASYPWGMVLTGSFDGMTYCDYEQAGYDSNASADRLDALFSAFRERVDRFGRATAYLKPWRRAPVVRRGSRYRFSIVTATPPPVVARRGGVSFVERRRARIKRSRHAVRRRLGL